MYLSQYLFMLNKILSESESELICGTVDSKENDIVHYWMMHTVQFTVSHILSDDHVFII